MSIRDIIEYITSARIGGFKIYKITQLLNSMVHNFRIDSVDFRGYEDECK